MIYLYQIKHSVPTKASFAYWRKQLHAVRVSTAPSHISFIILQSQWKPPSTASKKIIKYYSTSSYLSTTTISLYQLSISGPHIPTNIWTNRTHCPTGHSASSFSTSKTNYFYKKDLQTRKLFPFAGPIPAVHIQTWSKLTTQTKPKRSQSDRLFIEHSSENLACTFPISNFISWKKFCIKRKDLKGNCSDSMKLIMFSSEDWPMMLSTTLSQKKSQI